MKAIVICISLVFFIEKVSAQFNHTPTEVIVINEKDGGALFSVGEKMNFKDAIIRIPKNTVLRVLKMERIETEGAEGDSITFYFYYVEWNNKKNLIKGWVKAEDCFQNDY